MPGEVGAQRDHVVGGEDRGRGEDREERPHEALAPAENEPAVDDLLHQRVGEGPTHGAEEVGPRGVQTHLVDLAGERAHVHVEDPEEERGEADDGSGGEAGEQPDTETALGSGRPARFAALHDQIPERGEGEEPDLGRHEDRLARRSGKHDHRRRRPQTGNGDDQREGDQRPAALGVLFAELDEDLLALLDA